MTRSLAMTGRGRACLPVTQDAAYRGRVSGSFEDSWFTFLDLNLTLTF